MTRPTRGEIARRLDALERETDRHDPDGPPGLVDWFAELKKAEAYNQNRNRPQIRDENENVSADGQSV